MGYVFWLILTIVFSVIEFMGPALVSVWFAIASALTIFVSLMFDNIKIELVALESTNMVPLTMDIRDMWASQRKNEGVDFLGQSYAAVPPLTHYVTNSTYFLWDVLTTASFGKEDLVKREVVYSDVIIEGASQGRTIKKEDGRPVDLVYYADRDAFFEYITDLAKK